MKTNMLNVSSHSCDLFSNYLIFEASSRTKSSCGVLRYVSCVLCCVFFSALILSFAALSVCLSQVLADWTIYCTCQPSLVRLPSGTNPVSLCWF